MLGVYVTDMGDATNVLRMASPMETSEFEEYKYENLKK